MSTSPPPLSRPLPTSAASLQSRTSAFLWRLWSQPIERLVAALVIGAVSGLGIGLLMPRGPVDAREGMILLVCSLLAGLVAGFLTRSGWAAIIAPATNLIIFEVARRGEQGPSVDGIYLKEGLFGFIALVVGRGVYVLIGLLAMAIGVAYGVWIAKRQFPRENGAHSTSGRIGRWFRWLLVGAGTIATVGLAILLLRPAGVPAVTDAAGNPVPGGIAELTKIELGGYQQWIEIRGASPDIPVILYLNGGPGQSDLALSRALLEPLHEDFTVVGWDQRGAGKSYGSLDPETLTLQSVVDDTIELTNYLRERFGQEKIYLLTESWGSIPGILALQQHPELFAAYIGSGQMVDVQATDQIIYDDLLAYADAHGDADLAERLRGYGPPPYDTIWANAFVAQNYSLIEDDYDPPQAYIDRGEGSGVGPWGVLGSEYSLIDKANVIRGLLDMASVMYPQLQEIDFRQQAASLDVPIYILEGEHELRGRRELVHEWFDLLDAPVKELYSFANAGHAPAFEYADELHRLLVQEIVPAVNGTH